MFMKCKWQHRTFQQVSCNTIKMLQYCCNITRIFSVGWNIFHLNVYGIRFYSLSKQSRIFQQVSCNMILEYYNIAVITRIFCVDWIPPTKHKFNGDTNNTRSIAISDQICYQSVIILRTVCLRR